MDEWSWMYDFDEMNSVDKKQDDVDEMKEELIDFSTIDICVYQPLDLHNALIFWYQKLFIDIRPAKQYNTNSIYKFINIPINIKEKSVIDIIENTLTNYQQQNSIDIYCCCNKDMINKKLDTVWCKYLHELLCKIFCKSTENKKGFIFNSFNISAVDYEIIEKEYNYLTINCVAKYRKINQLQFPSIIIEDKLLLGDHEDAESKAIIVNFGITHIINMTGVVDNEFQNDKELSYLKYLKCELSDTPQAKIDLFFSKCIAFIDNAFNANNGNNNNVVLVHCFAGVSRSSTIILAYLMKIKKMKYIEAFMFTQHKRQIICPNHGFQQQLKLWEKRNYRIQ